MKSAEKQLLSSVLSLPTTSFHEDAISTFVQMYVLGLGLDVKKDSYGNLFVKYSHGKAARGTSFVAHMDHPGFEIISADRNQIKAVHWGRIDMSRLRGCSVVVESAQGKVKGKVIKALDEMHCNHPCVLLKMNKEVNKGDFGYLDLPALRISKDKISARAADNLISVSMLLELLTRLVENKTSANVTAIFTRAEEVGFAGAMAAVKAKKIDKTNPVIVLECSSAKAGKVKIGGGFVIRSGDKQSTYDPSVEAWLISVADQSAKADKNFRCQRAMLIGGRCEACVFTAEGYLSGGLALPLGNYHNQSAKGLGMEFVSAKDYLLLCDFLMRLAQNPMPKNMFTRCMKPLWSNFDKFFR